MTKKLKVAVGMSGGVDSGVAALLLKQQGYEVIGFHCHFWAPKDESSFVDQMAKRWENKCCSTESLEAARQTAHQLDIPFYTVDFRKDFKKQVVDYFIGEYKNGRTPNPCVMCNKFIKFGKLLEYAKSLGCDFLATGHYALIERLGDSHFESNPEPQSKILEKPRGGKAIYRLLKGSDKSKDQSYFLWTLTQPQLEHILFPIGHLTKNQVRKIAKDNSLPVAKRPESFEICFVPGNDYREFIKHQIPEAIKPGPVLNTKGEVIGEHEGLPLYTIGQRHGFKIRRDKRHVTSDKGFIESKGYIPPLYVVGIDVKKNALIVGRGVESERKEFEVERVNWINPSSPCHPERPRVQRGEVGGSKGQEIRCDIRIRHQGELLKSKIKSLKSKVKVVLDEPVRGITPGQSAVFYQGKEVLGGGIIK